MTASAHDDNNSNNNTAADHFFDAKAARTATARTQFNIIHLSVRRRTCRCYKHAASDRVLSRATIDNNMYCVQGVSF